MKNKKPLILGFLFGLISPIFGLFFGLQVSTFLGNLFTFPFIIIASITGSTFGNWNALMLIVGFALSGLCWAGIFWLLNHISHRCTHRGGKRH